MRFPITLGLAAALLAGAAHAGARDDMAEFTRGLKGLQGQFSQQVYDAKGRRKETTSGNVALSAPRLFRWEYEPDLQQATKRPQGAEEQNSPLAALIDPGRLERDFNVAETGSHDGLDWLELTPRAEAEGGFRTAKLGFDDKGLRRMSVVDALGQRTEIQFEGWKRNPAFAKGVFTFVPPEGVDVVGQG